MRLLYIVIFVILHVHITAQTVTQVKLRDLEDGLSERIVNKIARDTFGFFYLFSNNSIQRYDGKDFENVHLPLGAEKLLSDIDRITTDKQGCLLLHSYNDDRVLHIYPAALTSQYLDNTDASHSTSTENEKLNLKDRYAKYIVRDNDTIVASKGSFWKYSNGKLSKLGVNSIPGNNCNVLTKDKAGNIIAVFGLVANESNSILVLRTDGTIDDFSLILNYNDKIRDLYCDDIDHRCMIATFNGIYIMSFKRPGIEVFHSVSNVTSSGFGYLVMGVSAEGPHVIFGDENYGLRRIGPSGNVELLFPDETIDFFDNEKMMYDAQQGLYYTTANYTDEETVLYIMDTTFTKLKKQIIPFTVHNFRIHGDGEILLVGEKRDQADKNINGRLMLWNTRTSTGNMMIASMPSAISFEKVGEQYWIATRNGLFVYDESFVHKRKVEFGITHPYLLCIKEINDKIYAGSYGGGLYIIDKLNNEVIGNYSKDNFLSDNIVAGIEEDNFGNIWVSTFNGINVLNKEGHIISKIMGFDGISHREMNTNAISKDIKGNMYFGTLNGLTKINPQEVLNWSSSQGLHIKDATAFYKNNGKIVDLHENPIAITTGFDSLLISIDFPDYTKTIFDTPLNYLNVNDSSFKALSNNSKQLFFTSEDIEVTPTIKLHNLNNSYSNTLNFEPQFDSTNALISLLLLLCILGMILIIFYRNKFTSVVFEQDKKIADTKRVAELELSALQSQMNPHFIFNALGAIQYFIQTQKTEEADNFLADFALLMRKILESSKSKYITLKEEKEILDLYINIEQLRFEGLFDFQWHIDEEVDMDKVIPPMILQPFIENAINHGLYSLKERKGKLEIFITQTEDVIEYKISDNGIGREKAALLRSKSHKPRGMQIVGERIKTLNSLRDIEIDVSTQDLYDNGTAAGTCATIKIAYNSSEL